MSAIYLDIFPPEAEPLRDAMEKLDVAPVEKIVKKATDDLYQHLLDSVNEYMRGNLADAIDGAARELASRYLGEALAGDDEKLKRLLGLWYQHKPSEWSLLDGKFPDHWTLLRTLCERFPDLLKTEALRQSEAEVAALRGRIAQLEKSNRELRERL